MAILAEIYFSDLELSLSTLNVDRCFFSILAIHCRISLSFSCTYAALLVATVDHVLDLDHTLFLYPVTLRYTNYNPSPSSNLTLLLLKVCSPLSLTHALTLHKVWFPPCVTLSLHKEGFPPSITLFVTWPPPSMTLVLTHHEVRYMYSVNMASEFFTAT